MGLLRTAVWGLAFVIAGVVVALGFLPGASDWSPGPRAGVAALLLALGATVLGVGLAARLLRRDETGACPVGATCACGHFNLKPRRTCGACGQPTAFGA